MRLILRADFTVAATPMTTEQQVQFKTWMCLICGFVYDEAAGLPGRRHRAGHALGRRADELDLSRVRRAQGRLRDGGDLSSRRGSASNARHAVK